MFSSFRKTAEPDGKTVRSVKLLDYSGKCERSFDLPLRERLLWKTARYADVHGEFPDGELRFGRRPMRRGPGDFSPQDPGAFDADVTDTSTIWRNGAESGEALIVEAELERVRLACGTCHWCANQRKRRWERAAIGWIETAPLTLFGTLTFSDEFFASNFNAMLDEQIAAGVIYDGKPGFDRAAWDEAFNAQRTDHFDPANVEHDEFMRKCLMAERQKMMKRLRHALERDEKFFGIKLRAHLSVYEYGDLRSRLHMHYLLHFDIGEVPVGSAYSRLRRFLKKNWHLWGIGFTDVQHATPHDGVESAKYLFAYLLKYEEVQNQKRVTKAKSRLAVSLGYRTKGTDFWFGARPPIVPGGSLRPADPVPPEERGGFPASSGGDADREDLCLSAASEKVSYSDVGHDFRVLAEELARANLAWRDGELWPGWSAGLSRPEDHWAEIPPAVADFTAWLLSRDHRFEPASSAPDVPPWVSEDCSSVSEGTVNITGEFSHPDTGEPFSSSQWLSFTNAERAVLANGHVPPWWPDGVPPVRDCLLNLTNKHRALPPIPEVLGKSVSERAVEARGLGPDTVIGKDGSYLVHPDDVLRLRRKLVRNSDGSVFDAYTGEIVEDVEDADPPF